VATTGAKPTSSRPLDTRADSAAGSVETLRASGTRRISLLWWVFFTNAAVFVLAFLVLAFSPAEISAPVTLSQLADLLAGLGIMLALNFFLLRRVMSPLLRLTHVMSSIDPDRPGRRLRGVNPRSAEGAALAESFNAMIDRLEGARREASRAALAAQEAERLRVARELHDEIGQTLTAITIQAERAAGGDASEARKELARVADAIRSSLDEVRRIARELRPEALDDLGLVNALIALCSRLDAEGGPVIRRRLDARLPPLPKDVELVIYRVVQESLTNALRHADADTVTVSLDANSDYVTASVVDDGKGMPIPLSDGTAGISGMRERALLVGGNLSIESRPGEGTKVRFTLPIEDVDA
jgi:two-component system, NarL family, sensor histidine kinase UhpB